MGLGVADVDDQQHGANPNWPGPPTAAGRRPAGRPGPRRSAASASASRAPSGSVSSGVELEQRDEHEPPRGHLGVRAASAAPSGTRASPSSNTSTSIGRGPWRTPPGVAAELPLDRLAGVEQLLGAELGLDRAGTRCRKSRWSSTSPTGSVSYTDEDASTSTPRSRQRSDRRREMARAGRRRWSPGRGSPASPAALTRPRATPRPRPRSPAARIGGSGLAALTHTALSVVAARAAGRRSPRTAARASCRSAAGRRGWPARTPGA